MATSRYSNSSWILHKRSFRIQFAVFIVTVFAVIFFLYRLSSDAKLNEVADLRITYKQTSSSGNVMNDASSSGLNDPSSSSSAFIKSPYVSESISSLGPQRIIHLDLKGAPPRVSYLAQLFPLLHKLGATGVLIEYEDMFPYWGALSDIPAFNCYSKADINEINTLAQRSHLEVIPLIQTFGHMEFILKLHSHSKLREVFKYPQVICPTHNSTFPLISKMVEQILQLHPRSKRLHIGCDEVYHIGDCPRCISAMGQERWGKIDLFLNHVSRVASLVAAKGVKPLVWDDEFRKASTEQLRNWGLPGLVTPVVWKYTTDVASQISNEIWAKLSDSKLHPVFVATAFKGATGPDQDIPDINYHLENHRSWSYVANNAKQDYSIEFLGVILTGWQRYDHFAVLCELLPTSLPSLATNLAFLAGATSDNEAFNKARIALGCQSNIDSILRYPFIGLRCNFPGNEIMEVVARFKMLKRDLIKLEGEPTVKGWMTNYNFEHTFSNPMYVEHATSELDRCRAELNYIEKDMRNAMTSVYDRYTADEWIHTNIYPIANKLQEIYDAREKLLSKDEWPRRPLDITNDQTN